MIELIIFDLDGVIADTEDYHYTALMSAVISVTGLTEEYLSKFIKKDGTSTKDKLLHLSLINGLTSVDISSIDLLKQSLVIDEFSNLQPDHALNNMLEHFRRHKYRLAIGSNSRKSNVFAVLDALQITSWFDTIITGSDLINSKPSPEVFHKIMHINNVLPATTLILEDSVNGILAAIRSGAHLLKINTCADTTKGNIEYAIAKADNSCPNGRDGIQIY